MAVWTTPITWATGAVTAASFNTEIRDHLNWMKGFADVITASTAADSGTATRLHINRSATGNVAYSTGLSADAFNRVQIEASGKMSWGSGTAAPDVAIERLAANRWGVTGGAFEMKRDTTANDAIITSITTDTGARLTIEAGGALQWGDGTAAPDTELYRIGAGRLGVAVGDSFQIVGTGSSNALEFGTVGAPTSSLYEISVGRIQTGQQFRANQGLITYTKLGIPADVDFADPPASGHLAVDTTNSRFYVRVGTTWKYVALI